MSPAESTFERRNCEVPPGVDPVNGVAGTRYVRESERSYTSFIRVEPRIELRL